MRLAYIHIPSKDDMSDKDTEIVQGLDMTGMVWKTPKWTEKHTRLAEQLDRDLESGQGQHITYTSYNEYLTDIHGQAS